jgi:hypothetical protein
VEETGVPTEVTDKPDQIKLYGVHLIMYNINKLIGEVYDFRIQKLLIKP